MDEWQPIRGNPASIDGELATRPYRLNLTMTLSPQKKLKIECGHNVFASLRRIANPFFR